MQRRKGDLLFFHCLLRLGNGHQATQAKIGQFDNLQCGRQCFITAKARLAGFIINIDLQADIQRPQLSGRCSLRRWAILRRSTLCTQSKFSATTRVLFDCRGPIKCQCRFSLPFSAGSLSNYSIARSFPVLPEHSFHQNLSARHRLHSGYPLHCGSCLPPAEESRRGRVQHPLPPVRPLSNGANVIFNLWHILIRSLGVLRSFTRRQGISEI